MATKKPAATKETPVETPEATEVADQVKDDAAEVFADPKVVMPEEAPAEKAPAEKPKKPVRKNEPARQVADPASLVRGSVCTECGNFLNRAMVYSDGMVLPCGLCGGKTIIGTQADARAIAEKNNN